MQRVLSHEAALCPGEKRHRRVPPADVEHEAGFQRSARSFLTFCLSTLIRACLLRPSLRHRRQERRHSSLPAALTSLELYTGRFVLRISSRAFRTMCASPCSPPPFALITAHPSAPAPTLHVLRAAQAPVHRIRTDLARTVPPPRPEHARRHVSPLLRSRGHCTRLRCGLATPGIVGDLSRRDLRVRDGVVSTLPCTSCISSGRRRELVAAGR